MAAVTLFPQPRMPVIRSRAVAAAVGSRYVDLEERLRLQVWEAIRCILAHFAI